jgi:Fe2+ transport system protein FeoA
LLLSEAKQGQNVKIKATGGNEITYQTLRFGLDIGSIIKVEKNIKNGPTIISWNQLEIAIGHDIASIIEVELP